MSPGAPEFAVPMIAAAWGATWNGAADMQRRDGRSRGCFGLCFGTRWRCETTEENDQPGEAVALIAHGCGAVLDGDAFTGAIGEPDGALDRLARLISELDIGLLTAGKEDAEHFIERAAHRFFRRPAGDARGRWIHEGDGAGEVGCDHSVGQTLEGFEVAVLATAALGLLEVSSGGHFDGEAEFVFVEGFEQVAVRLRLASAGDGVEVGAGGDVNNGHGASLVQLARSVDAIDLTGEMHVHEDEIGMEHVKFFQRLFSGGADAHDFIVELAQRGCHVAAHEALVFDDQNSNLIQSGH